MDIVITDPPEAQTYGGWWLGILAPGWRSTMTNWRNRAFALLQRAIAFALDDRLVASLTAFAHQLDHAEIYGRSPRR
jgi:hypothetical protein